MSDYAITSHPVSAVVNQMESYRLEFKVSQPSTFQWYKDNNQLPLATNGVLDLTNVVLGDSGSYRATASRDGKTLESRAASIVCKPRVKVYVGNRQVSVIANIAGAVIVRMIPADQGAKIRYTLDGSEPNQGSVLYSSPFAVNKSLFLRVSVDGVETDPVRFKLYKK